MKKFLNFTSLLLIFHHLTGAKAATPETVPPVDKRILLPYVEWEAYMLGIDSPQKIQLLKEQVKRVPVIGLVTSGGLKKSVFNSMLNDKCSIEYVTGSEASCRNNHDVYQISEVLQMVKKLGFEVKIRVYQASGTDNLAAAFRRAGQESDLVLCYYSFWSGIQKLQDAVKANPNTLYITPYVEVGEPATGSSFQGGARHPDGSGLANFITTIPLARNAQGNLLTPSSRSKQDWETINFVTPSSYASGAGETCPSAGVAAVAASYIMASSAKDNISPEEVIQIMKDNVSTPEKRMLSLKNFNRKSVYTLREHLKNLTSPDKHGFVRLEADGVLDLWQIFRAMNPDVKRWGMKNVVISLFGSSIMEGRIGADSADKRYYAILQKKLSERFPEVCFSIINGAVGGWSTRELMEFFDQKVLKYSPDYCLVMFGANNQDMNKPERTLKDGELEKLMADFEQRLPANCRRIGVVLNPVIDSQHNVTHNPAWQELLQTHGGLNALLEKERCQARDFYRKKYYPVIDLAELMQSDPQRYILDSDGIHLTPEGHELFAEAAFKTLEKMLIGNGDCDNGAFE